MAKDIGRSLALEEIDSIVERYSKATLQPDRLGITAPDALVTRLFGADVLGELAADGGLGFAEVQIGLWLMSLHMNQHRRVAYDDFVEVRYAGGVHFICVPPADLEDDEVELYLALRAAVVTGGVSVPAEDAAMAARTLLVDGAAS